MTSNDYAELAEGIKLIWNNQFDQAEKLFEKKKGIFFIFFSFKVDFLKLKMQILVMLCIMLNVYF